MRGVGGRVRGRGLLAKLLLAGNGWKWLAQQESKVGVQGT